MGTVDRLIRVLIAVVIAILYLTNVISGVLALVLVGLAIIFVMTSLLSFCPLYALLRINTCYKK
ncbi:DUF2892 domain-containing protein [Flavobacterium sp. N1994]|uniref:YgaP family membrane protein n=1 Tax=Flavobacterium sp. N1994 TaxID=2986827 RepID=UPI0029CAC5DE|nr:DUF2892 domain-containing protein [Flavobacterium sp. N1994]